MRLYYTCPIIAAYMADRFGVKYGILWNGEPVWNWQDMLNTPRPAMTAEDILEDYPNQSFGNLYVHPESLPLFEPMEGDKDEDGYVFDGKVWSRGQLVRSKLPEDSTTAKRNNKPFFMPEREG